eukprot:13885833-Alexandrium_andersonii.AAC.1
MIVITSLRRLAASGAYPKAALGVALRPGQLCSRCAPACSSAQPTLSAASWVPSACTAAHTARWRGIHAM